jgi:hypothetical protein
MIYTHMFTINLILMYVYEDRKWTKFKKNNWKTHFSLGDSPTFPWMKRHDINYYKGEQIVWNKTTWNSLTHTRAEKTTDLSQVTDKLYHKLRTARPNRDSNSQHQCANVHDLMDEMKNIQKKTPFEQLQYIITIHRNGGKIFRPNAYVHELSIKLWSCKCSCKNTDTLSKRFVVLNIPLSNMMAVLLKYIYD